MPSIAIDAIVSKALDGLYLRQLTTANNLANANSPDFVPIRTSFESELSQLVTATHEYGPEVFREALVHFAPQATALPQLSAPGVRIDEEIAIASETSARYALLVGMLNRNLQLQQLAVRGS